MIAARPIAKLATLATLATLASPAAAVSLASANAAAQGRGGGMAARLDLLVAGVIGDAVDHRRYSR